METGRFMQRVRKWSRSLHRDLSYFFTGVLVVYAVSGFMLNHKKDFNSDYSIVREERKLATPLPQGRDAWNRERVAEAIAPYGGADAYLKHYFPEEGTLKVFIRGGSTFTLDLTTGNGLFESVRKRTVLSAFNRLHYNPSRWWTIFSDIFLAGLLVIVATGLVMVRGRNGLAGRGGAELVFVRTAERIAQIAFFLIISPNPKVAVRVCFGRFVLFDLVKRFDELGGGFEIAELRIQVNAGLFRRGDVRIFDVGFET